MTIKNKWQQKLCGMDNTKQASALLSLKKKKSEVLVKTLNILKQLANKILYYINYLLIIIK